MKTPVLFAATVVVVVVVAVEVMFAPLFYGYAVRTLDLSGDATFRPRVTTTSAHVPVRLATEASNQSKVAAQKGLQATSGALQQIEAVVPRLHLESIERCKPSLGCRGGCNSGSAAGDRYGLSEVLQPRLPRFDIGPIHDAVSGADPVLPIVPEVPLLR